jgi:pimeloyl-ACP methyl ester carboxylesterase
LPAALALGAASRALASPASGSGRFSVAVEGQGPDVILIPGLASSREVWSGEAERLLQRGFRTHMIQVAGFAGAPAGANASGEVLAPLVEDLAGYIRSQGLERPAVIGHAFGGGAGLMLAARHPDLVGRLMAVEALPFASVMFFGPDATVESVRPQADRIRDQALARSPAAYAKAEAEFVSAQVRTEAAQPARIEDAIRSDRSVTARAMHDLMVTDLRQELEAITAPVTVAYAFDAGSHGVPAETVDGWHRDAYARLKGVRLARIDDSLHFIMLDQPEKLAARIDAFLA